MSGLLTWLAGIAPAVGTTVLLRGALIVTTAALVARLLARASAATRFGVWALTFIALATVPLAGARLPGWTITAPITGPAVVHPAASAGTDPVAQVRAIHASGESAAAQQVVVASGERARVAAGTAVLIWLLGAILLVARLAVHAARAAGIARRGTVLDGLDVPGVRVVLSHDTAVPLVCGVYGPTVALPAGAAGWSPGLLDSVLAHETAHVHRRDYLLHLGSRIVLAGYWVNPLVWAAARRLAAERERACDDRVVRNRPAHEYASHLVQVAGLLRRGNAPALVALTMAGRHALHERVRNLLSPDIDRRPLSRPRLVLLGLALAAVAIPVASLDLRRSPAPDPALFTALHAHDPALRARAAWGFGEFESRAGIAALLGRLDDPDPAVRGAVVWALGEIKDRRVVEHLANALKEDGDPLVREMAAVALGEVGAPSAVQPLVEAGQRDPALLPAVLWSLGEIPHRSAATASRQLRIARPDVTPWIEDGMLRRAAVRAVRDAPAGGDLGEPLRAIYEAGRRRDLGALDMALGLLTADEPLVRASAAWALGRMGAMVAVDPLLGAMRDQDAQVRALAVWALDEINPTRARRHGR